MNIIINNNNAYNTHQAMMKELAAQREVALYCDIHGHSRKCNMFMYGCCPRSPSQVCVCVRVYVCVHVCVRVRACARA